MTCIPGVVACLFIKIGSYSSWTGPDIWLQTDQIEVMAPHEYQGKEACILFLKGEDRKIIASGSCDRLVSRIAANG